MEADVNDIIGWLKVASWIIGIGAVPVIAWAITMQVQILRVREDTKLLVAMHRQPDSFGFGTGETNSAVAEAQRQTTECIRENTRAIETLTHYIRWSTEEIHGLKAPPPIEKT